MLGELDGDGRLVICDLEAGVGAVVRAGQADLVLVVAEPMAKSIDVARRAAEIAADGAKVIVVANRVRSDADIETVRAAFPGVEVVAVPDDPKIVEADRKGVAPIDLAPDAPAVQALIGLARGLVPSAN